jgi:hypothetical protein
MMQVHFQLATLNSSITDYFHKLKTLSDTLTACGQPLNDFEAVSFLLAGLGSEFDLLVTSVTTRVDPISRDDIYGLLLAHKMRLEQQMVNTDLSNASTHVTARILALLASVIVASMLPMDVDSQMVVATTAPFLANVVSLLVDVVVGSGPTLMLQDPLLPSVRSATSWNTMPSPAINILISLPSMFLGPHCRLSIAFLVYLPMIAGTLI